MYVLINDIFTTVGMNGSNSGAFEIIPLFLVSNLLVVRLTSFYPLRKSAAGLETGAKQGVGTDGGAT